MSDRQMQFRDGAWHDTWNDQPAEPLGDPPVSELALDSCGCISDRVADWLENHLLTADEAGLIALDGNPTTTLLAVIADAHGFTEHGTSINVAWLTETGRAWLQLRNEEAK